MDNNKVKNYIETIEELEDRKSDLSERVREIMAQAKSDGFDTKTLRKILKLRKKSKEARREEQELLEIYANAIQLELW